MSDAQTKGRDDANRAVNSGGTFAHPTTGNHDYNSQYIAAGEAEKRRLEEERRRQQGY